jgi:hypothetical protein
MHARLRRVKPVLDEVEFTISARFLAIVLVRSGAVLVIVIEFRPFDSELRLRARAPPALRAEHERDLSDLRE